MKRVTGDFFPQFDGKIQRNSWTLRRNWENPLTNWKRSKYFGNRQKNWSKVVEVVESWSKVGRKWSNSSKVVENPMQNWRDWWNISRIGYSRLRSAAADLNRQTFWPWLGRKTSRINKNTRKTSRINKNTRKSAKPQANLANVEWIQAEQLGLIENPWGQKVKFHRKIKKKTINNASRIGLYPSCFIGVFQSPLRFTSSTNAKMFRFISFTNNSNEHQAIQWNHDRLAVWLDGRIRLAPSKNAKSVFEHDRMWVTDMDYSL